MRKLNMENTLGTAIFLTSKAMERAAEYRIKKNMDLTPLQWKTILTLNYFNGISQKELAGKIYVDGSTLVPVIDRMEKNGLVERKLDPKDRRNNLIFLTKKSKSLVDSIIKIIQQLLKEFYKGVSQKEQEKMRTELKKIMDNADKTLIQN